MRKYILAAVLVLVASGSQAALIDRGDGETSIGDVRSQPEAEPEV